MPKDTKTLGNNKARACESLGFVHKKRLCQRFDTTSFLRLDFSFSGSFLLFYITAGFYHIYHIVTQFLAFGDNIYIVNSRNMPLIIF